MLSCYTIEVNNSYLLLYVTSLMGKACTVICDILFFNGTTNVKNTGSILAASYPCISVGHRAEHVVALFFSDVFSKISAYKSLMNFAKRLCNIFGSKRHVTMEIFNKH